MSIRLPSAKSPLCDLFDKADFCVKAASCASMESFAKTLPDFFTAREQAILALALGDAIAGVNSICVRANGSIELVEFYKDKRTINHHTLWVFGEVASSIDL